MAHLIRNLLRKMKYGQEVIVVSGLPRSGTSMMMRMLEGGGLAIMTDQVRTADDDNPKGYYEFERVKDLETEKDKSYVKQARGKVLKVISFLLKDLPSDNFYRVVFMRRDTDEILASQNKMLVNRGEENEVEDERLKELYKQHLLKVNSMVRWLPNYEMFEVHYKDAIDDPKSVARQVNQFLGGHLDEQKMHEAVDRKLYRNRKEGLT
ncbi:MAG: sulfotransferase domain-containing protein [Planctomycetota bacterium]